MKCLICNKECKNNNGLGIHIKKYHNITSKEYYNLYLKQNNEEICPVCGSQNNFININIGYSRTCSVSCGQKHIETKLKKEKTNIAKYGKSTPLITKENLKNSHSKLAMAKKKQTMLFKYGYVSTFCNKDTQNKCKNTLLCKYGVDNPGRIGNNKKHNYKFKVRSSLEELLANALIENNIDFIYNYKCNEYPYLCDFYLPNKNIFVEIHGFWTHGGHWFDKNNINDINILLDWIKKSNKSDFIKSAIYCWTIYDLEKRNCAKLNYLNYVVLWTKQDILDWVKSNFEIRHDY